MPRTHPIWHRPGDSDAEIRSILRRPGHPRFDEIAADLLLATQDPDEIRRWCDLGVLAGAYRRRLRRRIRNRSVRSWFDLLFSAVGGAPGGREAVGRRPAPDRTPSAHVQALARRLRAVLTESGLSAAEAGRRMGVSRQRIHDLLVGRFDVTIGTLLRFARAVGWTLVIDLAPTPRGTPPSRPRRA